MVDFYSSSSFCTTFSIVLNVTKHKNALDCMVNDSPDSFTMDRVSDDEDDDAFLTNGRRHERSDRENTDEALSTSSVSETDSLEKDDRPESDRRPTNGVSNTDQKRTNGEETVIEREIRLQKEREDALAQQRRAAGTAAFFLRHRSSAEKSETTDCRTSEPNGRTDRVASSERDGPSPLPETTTTNTNVDQRRVKVRPVAEPPDETEGPIYKVLNESPIEREIRLALERERELKREKETILSSSSVELNRTSAVSSRSERPPSINGRCKSSPSFPSVKSRALDLLTWKSERSLQRKLATSRIQQEIEQQTQREMLLRAEGAIKNTSEDYTDGASRSLDGLNSTDEETYVSSLPSTPDSERAASSPTPPYAFSSVAILPSRSVHGETRGRLSESTDRAKTKNEPRSRYAVNNVNNDVSVKGTTNGVTTLPRVSTSIKGVMRKFISSRGKVIPAFSSTRRCNSDGYAFDGNDLEFDSTVDEIRPPLVPSHVPRRAHVSAENKIQAELEQMRQREEELRLLRAKQLATSQPNLTELVTFDEKQRVVESSIADGLRASKLRANSNPNLLDDSLFDSATEPIVETCYKPCNRRRSALIAQWEEKIMQLNNDN